MGVATRAEDVPGAAPSSTTMDIPSNSSTKPNNTGRAASGEGAGGTSTPIRVSTIRGNNCRRGGLLCLARRVVVVVVGGALEHLTRTRTRIRIGTSAFVLLA